MKIHASFPTVAILIAVLAAGCASTSHLRDAEAHYGAGQYAAAASSAASKLPDGDEITERGRSKYILDNLYAGSAFLMDGKPTPAAEAFKYASDGIAEQDDSIFGSGYPTRTYDASMAANYKALSLWAEGDIDAARIAFRLTAEAQERADERNARAIRKAEDEAEKRKAEEIRKAESEATSDGADINAVFSSFMNGASSEEAKRQIEGFQAQYSTWGVYGNFQVPSTWFLDGLFALANTEEANDLEHSSFAARKALGMTRSSPAKTVYDLAEARADGKLSADALDNVFAVVFENGLGPAIEERRFDIPLPYNGKVFMLSFALPQLVRRGSAYSRLIVRNGAVSMGATVQIADIDKVAVREFKARLPTITASQIFEATLKLAVQVAVAEAVRKKHGDAAAYWTSLATSVASAAVTGTDTRHWNLLPKEIQACVLRKPEDRMIELWVPGAVEPLATVSLPEKGLSVIYVKVPAPGLPPLVRILGQSNQ